MTDSSKTVQLRRYELVEGVLDDFVAWFTSTLIPARLSEGFEIEFAYADRDANQFVWAVSAPGDAARFAEVEAAYLQSEARAAAFAGQPVRVAMQHVTLVEPVA